MKLRWLIPLLFCLQAFGVTHYISKTVTGASDSNNGTAKSTPWLHMPGMATCASNCATYTPSPGDSFILYGGDTWTASDLGITWQWSGSNASPIYIGVDTSWYSSGECGASFCRPIFNASHSALTQASDDFINVYQNLNGSCTQPCVTFDNIEITGGDGIGSYVYYSSPYFEFKNLYMHGWATNSNNNGGCFTGATNVTGSSIHDSICDGTDTTQNWYNGFTGIHHLIYNVVIRYVVSGVLADIDIMHDILISNMVTSAGGDHCNGFSYSPYSGSTTIVYNVVNAMGTGCSGGVVWWANGDLGSTGGCVGCTAYLFNNVLYNDQNGITTGGHPSASSGTFYLSNNTIDTGAQSGVNCMGNGEASPRMTVNFYNTHCIVVSGSTICVNTGATCTDGGGNLAQTEAVANADNYTASQTYVYSPTASNSPTVGNGVNEQSLCTTLAGINAAAGTACQSDTTYAVSYNTSNHTVSYPARTVNAWPLSAAWDSSAYRFVGAAAPQGAPTPAAMLALR